MSAGEFLVVACLLVIAGAMCSWAARAAAREHRARTVARHAAERRHPAARRVVSCHCQGCTTASAWAALRLLPPVPDPRTQRRTTTGRA